MEQEQERIRHRGPTVQLLVPTSLIAPKAQGDLSVLHTLGFDATHAWVTVYAG